MTKRSRDSDDDLNDYMIKILSNDITNEHFYNDRYSIHFLDKDSTNMIRLSIEIDGNHFDLVSSQWKGTNEIKTLATCDWLFRSLSLVIDNNIKDSNNNWIESYDHAIDQFIIHRSCMSIIQKPTTATIAATVYINTMKITKSSTSFSLISTIINQWIEMGKLSSQKCIEHYHCLEDQYELRNLVKAAEGIAFVANGSILPRAGGDSDKMLQSSTVIPFQSPNTLEKEFTLMHSGKVKGMLIPKGVTVITGGGYNGKSTLLNALKVGAYSKIPGDGREFVIVDKDATCLRSEDGRYINSVNVSSFISNLPPASDLDTTNLCTSNASGSTSMAANVIENLEQGTSVMLLDEDTCASNFMIRDSRMRSLIKNEPIIPYIYRVNGLYKSLDVSSIVVVGGCGDWFDVQNQTIMMDNYECLDVTNRVRSISKTFCTGRVQFNGQGLVHQLQWEDDIFHRHINIHALYIGILKYCDKPSNLLLTSSLSGNSLHINDQLFIDLSKIEQRVRGAASTRGIGLAILFFVFKYSQEKSLNLIKLIQEFDDMKYKWINRNENDNNNNDNIKLLHQIHIENLNGKVFCWPRSFEIISAVNRCRLALFHMPLNT